MAIGDGSLNAGVLGRESILKLIEGLDPLIAGFLNIERQLQPNGFDLTLQDVSEYTSPGNLSEGSSELAANRGIRFDASGWVHLEPGPYLVTLNEIVSLPLHIMALVRPRSSLLRSGVALHTAVWDAGYHGRSQVMLTVHNPHGFRLTRNARIGQMIFMALDESVSQGYQGRYQGENLPAVVQGSGLANNDE